MKRYNILFNFFNNLKLKFKQCLKRYLTNSNILTRALVDLEMFWKFLTHIKKKNSIKNVIKRIFYNMMVKLTIWPLTKPFNITLISGIILRLIYYRFSITQASFWPIISNPIDTPPENYYNREWDPVDVNFSKTLYEEMNGESDPNDSNSESESDSETGILNKYSSVIIFNTFKEHMKNCSTPEQIVARSMDFIETKFPHQLLAKTSDELNNEGALINVFQEKLSKEIILDNEIDTSLFIFFRAGISTYNAAMLLDILNKPESQKVVEQVFFATVKHIVDKMNS